MLPAASTLTRPSVLPVLPVAPGSLPYPPSAKRQTEACMLPAKQSSVPLWIKTTLLMGESHAVGSCLVVLVVAGPLLYIYYLLGGQIVGLQMTSH